MPADDVFASLVPELAADLAGIFHGAAMATIPEAGEARKTYARELADHPPDEPGARAFVAAVRHAVAVAAPGKLDAFDREVIRRLREARAALAR